MKPTLFTLIFILVANVASAYQFHLQFSAPSGARGLTVIGYRFAGKTVVGNCSYYTVSSGSGRGGGYHTTTTYFNQACTWDLYGNLLSVAKGAPPAQSPLYTNGTEVVYAISGSETGNKEFNRATTGRDTGGFGFVNTPAAHYSWETANGTYDVIPYAPYSVSVNLLSDGDLALIFGAAAVVAQVSGTITPSPGDAYISGNNCTGALPPGFTCTVTVTYDPTKIACTGSPYGYAYTGIELSLSTNAGTKTIFMQKYTVTNVPICDD
jgi:hypothetical protein